MQKNGRESNGFLRLPSSVLVKRRITFRIWNKEEKRKLLLNWQKKGFVLKKEKTKESFQRNWNNVLLPTGIKDLLRIESKWKKGFVLLTFLSVSKLSLMTFCNTEHNCSLFSHNLTRNKDDSSMINRFRHELLSRYSNISKFQINCKMHERRIQQKGRESKQKKKNKPTWMESM